MPAALIMKFSYLGFSALFFLVSSDLEEVGETLVAKITFRRGNFYVAAFTTHHDGDAI